MTRPSETRTGTTGRVRTRTGFGAASVAARRFRSPAARARLVHRLGWTYAGRLPQAAVRLLSAVAAPVVVRHDGAHLQNLRRNLSVVTGRAAGTDLLRAAVVSYLRTSWEVLALPSWSTSQIVSRVELVGERTVRNAHAGPGAVVALPHSGNWDLAGAWACATGMPVSTVAEQLPEAEFASFLAFRRSLGMEVLSHRDPGAVTALVAAVRSRRVVCLVADRDLAGAGVQVTFAGQPVTMPVGPALVARLSGAALIPAVAHYGGEPLRRGSRMRLVCGPVIPTRPGRAGLVAMTQDLADFFAARLAEQPQDWHMMQPFFGLPPREPQR